MIVFDGSGSMAEMGFNQMDEPRIFAARRAVTNVAPEIAAVRRLGLMVYGPGHGDGCSGISLRFPPMPDAAGRVIGEVNVLQPAGETALTEAVSRAKDVLEQGTGSGTVVLVTDGKETCGGTPCQLAAELSGQPYTVHVIGFRVRGDFFAWPGDEDNDYEQAETVARCLADQTGGQYFAAESVQDLAEALRQTLGCKLLF